MIKALMYRMIYKVAISLKKVIIPFIPQKLKRDLKRKVFYKAFNLDQVDDLSQTPLTEEINGINLIGYARAEMGLGESCRIAARGIDTTDIPFQIINFVGTVSARTTDLTWKHKEVDKPQFNLNLFHINAEQLIEAYTEFGPSLFKGRYNIGYWHWELPEFPDEWVDRFKFVNEVWVPSKYVAESISAKSPVPVKIIPHGIEVKIDAPRDRSYYGLPEKTFLFLTMYDMNSLQERKNPIASVKAFQEAFAPEDASVGLVIKVNNANASKDDMRRLTSLIQGYSNIHIIEGFLSRNDTNALIACTDSYLSLHRCEGFGLGLAEAMYLGKPAIGTNWSANVDFMNAENSCTVRYKLLQIEQDLGTFAAGQYWADADVGHASEYMRRLAREPKYYQEIAARGQHTIQTDFSPQVVGSKIEDRLREINVTLGGRT